MNSIKDKYDIIVNGLSEFREFIENNDNALIINIYNEILSDAYELKEMIDNKAQDITHINIEDLESREFAKTFLNINPHYLGNKKGSGSNE